MSPSIKNPGDPVRSKPQAPLSGAKAPIKCVKPLKPQSPPICSKEGDEAKSEAPLNRSLGPKVSARACSPNGAAPSSKSPSEVVLNNIGGSPSPGAAAAQAPTSKEPAGGLLTSPSMIAPAGPHVPTPCSTSNSPKFIAAPRAASQEATHEDTALGTDCDPVDPAKAAKQIFSIENMFAETSSHNAPLSPHSTEEIGNAIDFDKQGAPSAPGKHNRQMYNSESHTPDPVEHGRDCLNGAVGESLTGPTSDDDVTGIEALEDVHMSDAAAPTTPPRISSPELATRTSDAAALNLPLENSKTTTTTPDGSPAPSVPTPSGKNIPKIYTASGEVETENFYGFPDFPDGDIQIVSISSGATWKLHAATLRNSSKVFRDLIDSQDALRPYKRRKDEIKSVRWKIEMVPWEKEERQARLRSFRIVTFLITQLTTEGLTASSRLADIANAVSASKAPHHKIYDNLFRCMYSLEPNFSTTYGTDLKDFITDVTFLLNAAEHLGAGATIRFVIEASLLRLGQPIYKHIANNSVAWCDIALRLRSSTLFRAAMTHVVGRFDLTGRDGVDKNFLRGQHNGALLMEFAAKKAAQLRDEKLRIERLLMEYYPPEMQHVEAEGRTPNREVYSNDIYHWQALTLIRQYISSAMMSNFHHRAADGGAWFYQCLGMGGEMYLAKEKLEQFHTHFAMSTKGKECLRAQVSAMKEVIKQIVRPLLVDHSGIHRTQEDPKPRYLVCAEIRDEELPWVAGSERSEGDR